MASISRQVQIVNDLGLHLRAAGAVVQVASRFSCEIWVDRDGARANAKSIMSVLSLAAGKSAIITLWANGQDAQDAVGALTDLIARGFDMT